MGVEVIFNAHFSFMTLDDLHQKLIALGAKPAHYGHFYRALFDVVPWPVSDDQRFPKKLLEALPAIQSEVDRVLEVVSTHQGEEEASLKLLFKLQDGHTIESVLLPREGVCVSTQVGCAVGCVFCMTGQSGLIRQLSDMEIVAQVIAAKKLRPDTRKVVFMGMGEPSHNLRNVLSSIDFLGTYSQIPHKNLVLSTVGDQRVFDALKTSKIKPALAISLHSTIEEKRASLLPRAYKISVSSLITQAESYARTTGYPIQYQWTLMKGVNDGDDELVNIEKLLAGKYAVVNFIPVNAVAGSPFTRPDWERCREMAEVLKRSRILAKFRHSAAQDVEGGCGQLRSRYLKETEAGDDKRVC